MKRYLRLVLLSMLLTMVLCFDNMNVSASEDTAIDNKEGRLEGEAPADFYSPMPRGDAYGSYHADKFKDYIIEKGVDVSYHNNNVSGGGTKAIDWKKVKNAGIDFAIIRVGARTIQPEGYFIYDTRFKENMKNAQAAGLDVGVYIYSQATNEEEAVEEAEYVLDKIEGYYLELPVVFDYEYYVSGDFKGRLKKSKMTDRQRTNVCKAFCEVIEDAGYDCMIYANRSMLTNDLYINELDDKYEIWLAEWTSKAKYTNDYTYWQYTSDGSVSGIPSKRVDMNYRYYLPYFKSSMRTSDSVYLNWSAIEEAEGYKLYNKLEDGTYELIGTNEGNDNKSFLYDGLTMNTNYEIKLTYYYSNEEGEVVEKETDFDNVTVKTLSKLSKVQLTGKALDASRIQLNWEKVEGADGYIVQRYSSADKKYITIKTIEDPEELSYIRTGLAISTTYKYRVRAYMNTEDGKEYGPYSAVKSVKTATTLEKPVLNANVISYSKVELNWERINGAKGYQIQRYNSSKGKYVTIKTITDGKTVSYTNTGLYSKAEYKYRVRATAEKSGDKFYSLYSSAKTVKTPARVATPELSVSTKSYTTLVLNWEPVEHADGYVIQRYDSADKKYETLATLKDGERNSFTNTYLNADTTYKYRIRAYRIMSGKKYYSYYSDTASAKTGENRTGIVTYSKLSVRSKANKSSSRLCYVRKDDEVTITGTRKGDWYRIKIKVNGKYKTGFVLKKYVQII